MKRGPEPLATNKSINKRALTRRQTKKKKKSVRAFATNYMIKRLSYWKKNLTFDSLGSLFVSNS